jgi:hypothetical protein
MNRKVGLDENITCTTCGRPGAYGFETEPLCLECYAERGACCAEREQDYAPRTGTTEAGPREPNRDPHARG